MLPSARDLGRRDQELQVERLTQAVEVANALELRLVGGIASALSPSAELESYALISIEKDQGALSCAYVFRSGTPGRSAS
jgi:hypothetical protein